MIAVQCLAVFGGDLILTLECLICIYSNTEMAIRHSAFHMGGLPLFSAFSFGWQDALNCENVIFAQKIWYKARRNFKTYNIQQTILHTFHGNNKRLHHKLTLMKTPFPQTQPTNLPLSGHRLFRTKYATIAKSPASWKL